MGDTSESNVAFIVAIDERPIKMSSDEAISENRSEENEMLELFFAVAMHDQSGKVDIKRSRSALNGFVVLSHNLIIEVKRTLGENTEYFPMKWLSV